MILDGGATAVGLEFDRGRRDGRDARHPAPRRRCARRHRARARPRRSPWPRATPTSRHRPACWRATTRPRAGCASMRARCATARRCWRSARQFPAACRPDDQPQRRRATSPRPPPTSSPPCARSTPRAPRPSPSCRSRSRAWARPSTTACGAPRGRHERTPTARAARPTCIDRFRAIVGPEHALTDPDQQLPYLREWRDLYEGRASIVLRPGHDRGSVARSWRSPTSTAFPSCRRPATPASSAARSPMHGEILLSVGRLKRVRASMPPATP